MAWLTPSLLIAIFFAGWSAYHRVSYLIANMNKDLTHDVEKTLNSRFDTFESRMNQKIDIKFLEQQKATGERFARLETRIDNIEKEVTGIQVDIYKISVTPGPDSNNKP